MRKYLYGFKLYFLSSFHYRFNTVAGLLFGNLSMLITILFWNLIYGGDTQKVLNGFTLSGMITYFIISSIVRSFILMGGGFSFSGMIKSGSLGPALIKPRNLSMSIYFQNLAGSFTGLIPQTVFIIVLLPLIGRFMTWDLTITNILFMLLFLIVGSVTSHLTWSIFSFMAFWLEESNAVMWSFAVLLNMATGMFVPLDFFPRWSIGILEMSPFSSWGYIPTKIYLGLFELEKMIILLTVHVAWIGVLLLLNILVFRAGVKKYSSVGG